MLSGWVSKSLFSNITHVPLNGTLKLNISDTHFKAYRQCFLSVAGEESSSIPLGCMAVKVPLQLWPLSREVSQLEVKMHPFGCESETSLQELFEYFKRCLQHGEWELASACVPQLVDSTGGLAEKLQDIIKAIVCHPYSLKWVTQQHVHKTSGFYLHLNCVVLDN